MPKRRTCRHPVAFFLGFLLVLACSIQNIFRAMKQGKKKEKNKVARTRRSSKELVRKQKVQRRTQAEHVTNTGRLILRSGTTSTKDARVDREARDEINRHRGVIIPMDKLASSFPSDAPVSNSSKKVLSRTEDERERRLKKIHHYLFDLNLHPPCHCDGNNRCDTVHIPEKIKLGEVKKLYRRVREKKLEKRLPVLEHHRERSLSYDDNAEITDQFLPFHSEREYKSICEENINSKNPSFQIVSNVRVAGPNSYTKLRTVQSNSTTVKPSSPVKILCAIYTYEPDHLLVQSAIETWGHRCDGFLAASNATDAKLNILDMPRLYDDKERYESVWQKVRSMWIYLYRHYMFIPNDDNKHLSRKNFDTDYDYFVFCGSDTHIVVENLRWMLETEFSERHNRGEPLFLGQPVPYHGKESKVPHFLGGGSGYVLNHAAAVKLVQEGILLGGCRETTESAAEDMIVSQCLYDHSSIIGIPTHDEYGAQRFNGYKLDFFVKSLRQTDQLKNKEENNGTQPENTSRINPSTFLENMFKLWQTQHGVVERENLLDEISPYSVSFHKLRSPVAMKRHHAMIYKRSCPPGSRRGETLIGRNNHLIGYANNEEIKQQQLELD